MPKTGSESSSKTWLKVGPTQNLPIPTSTPPMMPKLVSSSSRSGKMSSSSDSKREKTISGIRYGSMVKPVPPSKEAPNPNPSAMAVRVPRSSMSEYAAETSGHTEAPRPSDAATLGSSKAAPALNTSSDSESSTSSRETKSTPPKTESGPAKL